MEKNEKYTNNIKENIQMRNNINDISNLKNELSSKDKEISKLQKELQLSNLKNNLATHSLLSKDNNINTYNSFHKYESCNNFKDNFDLLSNKTYSINRNESLNQNLDLDDIQNQISELNFQLEQKKNLLKLIKIEKNNEQKSKTCSNWKVNESHIISEELKDKLIKCEEEKSELRKMIKIKNKNINKLKNENKNNK